MVLGIECLGDGSEAGQVRGLAGLISEAQEVHPMGSGVGEAVQTRRLQVAFATPLIQSDHAMLFRMDEARLERTRVWSEGEEMHVAFEVAQDGGEFLGMFFRIPSLVTEVTLMRMHGPRNVRAFHIYSFLE